MRNSNQLRKIEIHIMNEDKKAPELFIGTPVSYTVNIAPDRHSVNVYAEFSNKIKPLSMVVESVVGYSYEEVESHLASLVRKHIDRVIENYGGSLRVSDFHVTCSIQAATENRFWGSVGATQSLDIEK